MVGVALRGSNWITNRITERRLQITTEQKSDKVGWERSLIKIAFYKSLETI